MSSAGQRAWLKSLKPDMILKLSSFICGEEGYYFNSMTGHLGYIYYIFNMIQCYKSNKLNHRVAFVCLSEVIKVWIKLDLTNLTSNKPWQPNNEYAIVCFHSLHMTKPDDLCLVLLFKRPLWRIFFPKRKEKIIFTYLTQPDASHMHSVTNTTKLTYCNAIPTRIWYLTSIIFEWIKLICKQFKFIKKIIFLLFSLPRSMSQKWFPFVRLCNFILFRVTIKKLKTLKLNLLVFTVQIRDSLSLYIGCLNTLLWIMISKCCS